MLESLSKIATDLEDANRRLLALDEFGLKFYQGSGCNLTDFGFEVFKLFAKNDKLELLAQMMNMDEDDVIFNITRQLKEGATK